MQVQLLPYRPLGLEKYASLNRSYPLAELQSYDVRKQKKELDHLVELMRRYGVSAVVGSSAKIVEGT